MNLDEIEKKCFILALFIRDDKQRFLLGSGAYEFKEKQLHFAANVMSNDVVEVQGNDGYMLAGQVRRPTTQVFDGYIGDATVNKQDIEGYRRDFFGFFQKNHFYTVVYIFPDGSAIQRRRGFIVDSAEVKELWQLFPEYHIGMNFEDINYYKYSENEEGEETYGSSAEIALSTEISGGLIWDDLGIGDITEKGTDLVLNATIEDEPIEDVKLYGNIEQKTMSGKNLLPLTMTSQTLNDVVFTVNADGSIKALGTASARTEPRLYQSGSGVPALVLENGVTYHNSMNTILYFYSTTYRAIGPNGNYTPSADETVQYAYIRVENGESVDTVLYPQLEQGSQGSAYEQYCGGISSPNPDYPQSVDVVSGEQTITISDGGSDNQEYGVDLIGKNLFDKDAILTTSYIDTTGAIGTTSRWCVSAPIKVISGEDYTYSGLTQQGTATRSAFYNDKNQPIEIFQQATGSNTITAPAGSSYVRFSIYNYEDGYNPETFQFEKGATATTYENYWAYELCKMGNYQDYIYKDGEDWYLHKTIGKKVLNGKETGWTSNNPVYYLPKTQFSGMDLPQWGIAIISDYFMPVADWAQLSIGKMFSGASALNFDYDGTATNLAGFKAWLGSRYVSVYAPLITATDTKITNATLIGQLEDLLGATTYSGITLINVDGNLKAVLEITAKAYVGGGIVWDENGAEWEEGGGGNTTVMVDSIENVYPVWNIKGPVSNPVLTNLTTGTSISYAGSISANQTLVIDMLNQTAKLNGTSVIGNVAGEWLEFIPGNNTVSYSADNADAPNSTIEWQEVVG